MVAAWPIWLFAGIVISAPWFRFHLNLFRLVDTRLYILILAALPAGIAAGWFYSRFRQGWFWRYEPALFCLIPVALGLAYAPRATAVTLWFAATSAAAGRMLLRRAGLPAELGIAILTGFGSLSCALFVLGISGEFRARRFAVLLGGVTALCWREFPGIVSDLRRWSAWGRHEELKSALAGVSVFAAAMLELLACLSWLTPVWNGDALRIHLALVRVFLASHSLEVPRAMLYGYYPQGYEVLAAMSYALGGQYAAQAVDLLFFLVVLWLMYQLARACGIGRVWAVAGVVMGASVPFLHWSGTSFGNDVAVTAYELGALLCYFRWRESANFRWIIWGGFLIAMSFGVKHVALFGAVPMLIQYAIAVWRTSQKVKHAAALCLVFVCFGLFWQARAYLATGNPVFPASIHDAVTSGEKLNARSRVPSYVSFPFRLFTQGKALFPSPSTEPAGIVLLLLAPLWLILAPAGKRRRSEAILWFFVILFYLFWGWVLIVIRFAGPFLLLLIILGAARLESVPRWAAMLCLTATLVFAAPVLIVMEMAPAQIPLFLKRTDGAGFLRAALPSYGAVEFLNRHARPEDHIASVDDWAVAYAPNPANFEHSYKTRRNYSSQDVLEVLDRAPANWLILPKVPNLADLETAARTRFEIGRVYQDDRFLVYRLAPKNPPPGPN